MSAPRIPGGIPPGASGADLEFYRLADRYLADLFEAFPSAATAAGFHVHDTRLDDWSVAGVRAKTAMARTHHASLQAIDPARLTPGARVDLGILRADADSTLLSLEELRPHERDPQFFVDLLGNSLLYLTLLDPDSPAWPERLDGVRGRLEQTADFLAGARATLDRPARVVSEMVLQTNAGNIRFLTDQLPALFDKAPALRPALEAANRKAIAALQEFQAFVEKDLLPRSTGDWRLGGDLWGRKLRLTLQSEMDAATIARRAEEAIASLRVRMLAAAEPVHARLFPGHRHGERGDDLVNVVVREVIEAVSERRPTRATLFETVRRAVDRIKGFLREEDLLSLPPEDDRLAIEPTPGFLDGMAVAFFNPPPTLEPALKKSFWISSVPRSGSPEEDARIEASFLREYNDYALHGLAIHEAWPGHYVQYWHAYRSPMATLYKKVFSSGTFAEGWAVLAERLMFEAGYGADDPAFLLMHLKHGLRAPINALIDARLHTGGGNDEEADRFTLDLLRRTGFQEETEARGKLRRAKVTSTQLSTYFVGLLEMQDLLDDALRAAGPGTPRKKTLDRMLSFGTIPPRDVRALMGLPPRG
ncbi:MAG TPA: DUF885 domain-containing protein [Candidatus Polarisedimenticolia bacterium]|nr:DUF885 domain-containing protein [Candidatus Polarisedimenticolia bacterium]